MASVSGHRLPSINRPRPNPNPNQRIFRPLAPSQNPRISPNQLSGRLCLTSRAPDLQLCKCSGRSNDLPPDSSASSSSGEQSGWRLSPEQIRQMAGKVGDPFVQAAKSAGKRFQEYFNSCKGATEKAELKPMEEKEEDLQWDWERWQRHFAEVEEQERMVSVLKAQLRDAVLREDYDEAAKLKVAIAAAATNDTVSKVISRFNKAVSEEHYEEAALIRDEAGAGLLGWWFGTSQDSTDPYGRIIHISASHGRYIAKSYSSRQLATASPGIPLFEMYVATNSKGDYLQQAVYLKKSRENMDFQALSPKILDAGETESIVDSTEEKDDEKADLQSTETVEASEDVEEKDEEIDVAEGLSGVLNILRDMIPGAKVKVLKVISPGKVDKDLITKAFERIMDEEDEDEDDDAESTTGSSNDINIESSEDGVTQTGNDAAAEEKNQIAVKLVIGGLVQKLSTSKPNVPIRVPAKLEKMDRFSFMFQIEKDENQLEVDRKSQMASGRIAKHPGHRRIGLVTSDLAKVLVRGEKVPGKVLKDVGDFINFALSQFQNRQALSGTTVFHRIEMSATSDPLNGLFVGAHGPYSSEVIHLKRRYGQWKEDSEDSKHHSLEFYEYVEAVKITGDPYVPAGQVAFRAKVGKHNQLPHRGIIPEEFGVVARYRGQGRLAEPGFKNPRWVDGELVILDGKYVKAGPMVGFVYWAPEYHFLVFFNRLRLKD